MDDVTGHDVARERPYLLMVLGLLGFAGVIVSIAGILIAPLFVPDYSWVADTISDLAAGKNEIVADLAIYAFAVALAAVALGAAHAHLGGIGWSCGVLSLAMLAALVVTIGARNEYGDSDGEGVVLHIYFVYGLGLLFLVAPLAMAQGAGNEHGWAKWTLIALGLLWGVATPVFFFLPTGIDGLYERGLGLIGCAIVTVLSYVFWRRGRDALRDTAPH